MVCYRGTGGDKHQRKQSAAQGNDTSVEAICAHNELALKALCADCLRRMCHCRALLVVFVDACLLGNTHKAPKHIFSQNILQDKILATVSRSSKMNKPTGGSEGANFMFVKLVCSFYISTNVMTVNYYSIYDRVYKVQYRLCVNHLLLFLVAVSCLLCPRTFVLPLLSY